MTQAELAKLEHAFASAPTSEAYRPLAEAYLTMGRYVEAMVVCKKGAKANPQSAEPRILLARVYAAQNKDKKALEELLAAAPLAPSDKGLLRMTGALHMKLGETEAGKAKLSQAYAQDPSDAETLAALKQWNVSVASVRPVVSTPVASPPPPVEAVGTPPPSVNTAPAPRTSKPTSVRESAYRVKEEVVSEVAEWEDYSQKKTGRGRNFAFFLLFLAPIALGAYFFIGKRKAETAREVKKHLIEASKFMKRDTLSAYEKASDEAEAARELDLKSPSANGYLAYIYAIRFGEYGGGDDYRSRAEKYAKVAVKGQNAYGVAAQALVMAYQGRSNEALALLQNEVQRLEREQRANTHLYATLGQVKMNIGDFAGARAALENAKSFARDDARVYSLTGELAQRSGLAYEAMVSYDAALSVEPTHADSLLGRIFLLLDQESPDKQYIMASDAIKSVLKSVPALTPRHKAQALMLRALLVSRVGTDLGLYEDKEFVKELSSATGVGTDKKANNDRIKSDEDSAFSEAKNSATLFWLQGRRKVHEQDFAGAAESFRKAVELDETRAQYHVELASALMEKQGGEKEAEQAIRKGLTVIPGSPKLLVQLGHALSSQKKMDEALAQYESALKDSSVKNPDARLALGTLYRQVKKDPKKSIEQLELAAKEYQKEESYMLARVYAEWGLSIQETGDVKRAKELYVNALKLDPYFSEPYFYAARLFSSDEKEKTRAKEFAAKYLELSPDGAFARDAKELR